MIKTTAPQIGDYIITKKSDECIEGMKGIIVFEYAQATFGVMFKKNKSTKTAYLDFNSFFCLLLKSDMFKVKNSHIEKNEKQFTAFMNKKYFDIILDQPNKIQREKDSIESLKRSIKQRQENNKTDSNVIIKRQETIEQLEKEKFKDPEDFSLQYQKLKKHPSIADILFEDNYLIIKTKNLTYHHSDERIQDFNLGAYYLFISNNPETYPKAINYKKQINKGSYFHPCIKNTGEICLGDNVRKEIIKYQKENNFLPLIYLLINFLQEPNYGSPYCYAGQFRCAQKVTYKPKKIIDYLTNSNWSQYEKWDQKKYLEDCLKLFQEDRERLKNTKFQEDAYIIMNINSLTSQLKSLQENQ